MVREHDRVVAAGHEAEQHLESANAAVEVHDVDAAVAHLSAAIRMFTTAGERRGAAMACAHLGDLYANVLGNLTAARAWFARAIRLLEDEPPCVEQGWVAVTAMGCDVDDPAVLLARAEFALDRARRFGDVNLETKALADAGLAHVQAGRLAEGMALLDEAMALACGPADDRQMAGKSVCSFFTACYYAADFDRAGSWARSLRERGLIGRAPGHPIWLSSHCDSVQATLLFELGRWGEAEALLTRAISDFEASMPSPSWHPAIALADLRIAQGRLADAEILLLGKDGHLEALLPAARLHLARGEHDLARAAVARGLRAVAGDRLRAADLLAVLAETELAAGDLAAAAAACADLDARVCGLDVACLRARSAATRARVMVATGEVLGAKAHIQSAVDCLSDIGSPWLRATLLVELARLHEQAGNRAAASLEAKAAAATLAGLDVVLPADWAALLTDLGATVPGVVPGWPTAILTREARGWVASFGGERALLANTKGLRYLAELFARPGVERHALDLVDRVEGVTAGGPDRRQLGDAGALIDARARLAYRYRIEQLRSEIDDALEAQRLAQAEAIQAELDQLVAQLAQAFGLGGSSRRAASAAERARLNVTRAVRTAIARITEALPDAGAALDRSIRTGLYCVYDPDDRDEVRWIVQS